MADLTTHTMGNPIVITGTTDVDSVILDSTKFVYIQKIRWVGVTTTAHVCSLYDGDGSTNGKEIWTELAETISANTKTFESDFGTLGHPCYGLTLAALDSGALYIYLVQRRSHHG